MLSNENQIFPTYLQYEHAMEIRLYKFHKKRSNIVLFMLHLKKNWGFSSDKEQR